MLICDHIGLAIQDKDFDKSLIALMDELIERLQMLLNVRSQNHNLRLVSCSLLQDYKHEQRSIKSRIISFLVVFEQKK